MPATTNITMPIAAPLGKFATSEKRTYIRLVVNSTTPRPRISGTTKLLMHIANEIMNADRRPGSASGSVTVSATRQRGARGRSFLQLRADVLERADQDHRGHRNDEVQQADRHLNRRIAGAACRDA